MRMYRRLLLLAAMTGLALHGYQGSASSGDTQQVQDQAPPKVTPRLDRGKSDMIEPGIKAVIVKQSGGGPRVQVPPPAMNRPRLDVGKTIAIEPHLKALIAAQRTAAAAQRTAAAPTPKAGTFVNQKVAAGKVSWHPSFKDACAAAAKSKKPVLLFQLMGKLDDQFC